MAGLTRKLRDLLGIRDATVPTSTGEIIEASDKAHKEAMDKLREQEVRLRMLDLQVDTIKAPALRARKKRTSGPAH